MTVVPGPHLGKVPFSGFPSTCAVRTSLSLLYDNIKPT